MSSGRRPFVSLVIFFAVCFVAAGIGTIPTAPQIPAGTQPIEAGVDTTELDLRACLVRSLRVDGCLGLADMDVK